MNKPRIRVFTKSMKLTLSEGFPVTKELHKKWSNDMSLVTTNLNLIIKNGESNQSNFFYDLRQ
jgi:hypothetical protein